MPFDATYTRGSWEPDLHQGNADPLHSIAARWSGMLVADCDWVTTGLEKRSTDVAVVPGELATEEVIEDQLTRARLANILFNFYLHGYEHSPDLTLQVSRDAAMSAIRFVQALPRLAKLPKVAPDDDCGVELYWQSERGAVVVTIDDRNIHCVAGAGTARAVHFNNLPFGRGEIPAPIREVIRSL